jgi:tRNA(fMet)-specific endonuclease VapC
VTFLLDTNVFSDLMREDPRLDTRLAACTRTDRVVICPIVRGEVRFGLIRMAKGRRRRALEARATALFTKIPSEPIPDITGEHYAAIKLSQQRRGLPLDENDLWIAATALALGAVLVSRDSDFQKLDGLTVEDWSV